MSRVGLVLGAGGVTGEAFHHGVLAALQEVAGWDPRDADVITGTSAGSIVAARLRCDGAAEDGEIPPVDDVAPPDEYLRRRPAWSALGAAARRPWRTRAGVLATSLVPPGTRSTAYFVDPLRRRCSGDWPDRTLYVCAVRRRDGARVVFGQPGAPDVDVATAVAASCAIPGYFRPQRIDGEVYVDGGVHSPTNLDVVADLDLDLVVVSSPMSVARHDVRAKADLGLRLLYHRYVRRERRAVERRGAIVLTVEPGGETLRAMTVNTLRADRVDVIEEHARAMTVALLARPEQAGRVALLRRRS